MASSFVLVFEFPGLSLSIGGLLMLIAVVLPQLLKEVSDPALAGSVAYPISKRFDAVFVASAIVPLSLFSCKRLTLRFT